MDVSIGKEGYVIMIMKLVASLICGATALFILYWMYEFCKAIYQNFDALLHRKDYVLVDFYVKEVTSLFKDDCDFYAVLNRRDGKHKVLHDVCLTIPDDCIYYRDHSASDEKVKDDLIGRKIPLYIKENGDSDIYYRCNQWKKYRLIADIVFFGALVCVGGLILYSMAKSIYLKGIEETCWSFFREVGDRMVEVDTSKE